MITEDQIKNVKFKIEKLQSEILMDEAAIKVKQDANDTRQKLISAYENQIDLIKSLETIKP